MARVMISIPDSLLTQIDRVAKAEHRKRSEFFKELALRYLHKLKSRKKEFAYLEEASQTSQDFWDNPIDDETWNES